MSVIKRSRADLQRIDDLDSLTKIVGRFAEERDWNQFHSPKNLAMALMVEAAELGEHFQWVSEAESHPPGPDQRQQIALEIADVLGIDVLTAAAAKIALNEKKYPVELSRGKASKYTDYQ